MEVAKWDGRRDAQGAWHPAVICAKGHVIPDVAPWIARAYCHGCQAVYEIVGPETTRPQPSSASADEPSAASPGDPPARG